MTAARQKGAGKPAENKHVNYKTVKNRTVIYIQKRGQKHGTRVRNYYAPNQTDCRIRTND